MKQKILFNILAKDLENAKEVSAIAPERVLVGLMVKSFKTNEEAIKTAESYMENGVLTSIGLGAGDPAMWRRVAEVACAVKPFHINQVFPAAGYTLGKLEGRYDNKDFIINSLIEPADEPGKVYISTGAVSQHKKEAISCEAAAKLMADIGLCSVKFYPVKGNEKLDHIRAMAEAAVKEGIEIFEPTGSLSMDNVHEVVQVCLDAGVKTVIPHLYTSLVDKETGKTNPAYIETLHNMEW